MTTTNYFISLYSLNYIQQFSKFSIYQAGCLSRAADGTLEKHALETKMTFVKAVLVQ